MERYIELYQTGERIVAAKTAMERKKSEYLQLAREHEVKETEKSANLARFQADAEEHALRRDKTDYQRRHLEQYVEGGARLGGSESEQQLNDAKERRQLDARWELHESLRPLNTLIRTAALAPGATERPYSAYRSLSSHEQSRGFAVRR